MRKCLPAAVPTRRCMGRYGMVCFGMNYNDNKINTYQVEL
jgi:hypothetical protein